MEIQIAKVSNGYIVQVPGSVVTQELQSFMPMFATKQSVYNFVFPEIMEMLVFLHHLFESPIEGKVLSSKIS